MPIRVSHIPGRPDLGGEAPRRGNKFSARRTACSSGHMHDSAAEARRCAVLTLRERAGEVRNLVIQPKFFFALDGSQVLDMRGRPIRFTADFRYDERPARGDDWLDVVEDVKSVATMTEAATLRMAFFRAFHPKITLRILK
jgi:hypothetical protein